MNLLSVDCYKPKILLSALQGSLRVFLSNKQVLLPVGEKNPNPYQQNPIQRTYRSSLMFFPVFLCVQGCELEGFLHSLNAVATTAGPIGWEGRGMREGFRDLSNAIAIMELKITSDKSLAFCSLMSTCEQVDNNAAPQMTPRGHS